MNDKNNLEFYKYLQGLKKVTRYKTEKPLQESTADHSYMTIALANDIIDKYKLNLNKTRVIEILIYHDLSEIGMVYDFPAAQTSKNKDMQLKKNELENNTILNMTNTFCRPEIKQNFDNFENPTSQEEIFAKLIDKLETMIHITNEHCAGFSSCYDYEFIIKYCDKYNVFEELHPLINNIKEELKKCYDEYKNKEK